MVARTIWPQQVWQSGTNENSLPANDNALSLQAAVDSAIDFADSAPVGPSEDDQYIVGTTWGGFASGNIVIYKAGTWLEFESFVGQLKTIDGDVYQFDGTDWDVLAGGGGGGVAPVVTDATTNLDATAANAGNYTRFTNSGAKTYTFDDAESFGVGDEYHGRNVGSGDLTITEAGTMTINPPFGGTLVIPQGGTFTVKIVASDEADLFGVTVPV